MKTFYAIFIAIAVAAPLSSCISTVAAPLQTAQPQAGYDDLLAQANVLYAENRFSQALTVYQQARHAPGLSATEALTLAHQIGRTQTRMRLFDAALASLDLGMEILLQSPDITRKFLEPVLRQARGEALRGMGKPAEARNEYTLAASAYQALANEAFVARMEAEIGSTYVDEANFSDALLHYGNARRRLAAIDSAELGRLLVNTSSLLTWLGKYDEALVLQAQAERACIAQDDAPCHASAVHAQGFTRFQQGDYAASVAASLRALQLMNTTQQIERARALNNLGLALAALKRPQEALNVLQEAKALYDQAAGDAKDKATVIDSMATAYRNLGDYRTANRLYQEALPRWRIAGHREGERDTFANLGQLAADMHEPGMSIFYYKMSINLAQSLRADSKRLEAGYRDALTKRLTPSYLLLAGALVEQGRLVEAHQVVRMLKEQELFEFLRGDSPAGATRAALTGPELAQGESYEQRQQPLFTLTRDLEALYAKPSSKLTPAEQTRIAALQDAIQKDVDALEHFLVSMNQDLARSDRPVVAIKNGQLEQLRATLATLGRGAVILHYLPLPDRLNIILTSGAAQAIRPYTVAVSEKDLNAAIFRFREQIANQDHDVRKTAAQLYGWLMPPALRADLHDAGAKILMVSSAESLRYLPFSALFDGRQWLTERYAVTMFDDAATATLGNAPQLKWRVRAFGMTQAASGFPALAWVRNELDAIVGPNGLPGTADVDSQFTHGRLRDALTQRPAPVLHIASHFVYKPGTEDDSFLLLGVGRLTLTDIKRMTFNGLDLLTLSACETAMSGGRNRNGREIESFAALAQTRGAHAVLATLWSVDDISTAAFMQRFYATRRTGKVTKVEALQAAQLAMIRHGITATSARASLVRGSVEGGRSASVDYAHPFYWAPFVLSGNWR